MRKTLAFLAVIGFAAPAYAQTPVIRTETRVVLVDAVVTDRRGNYVHDLKQKDFRVWEDNKEQTVTSFSLQSEAAKDTNDQKRYLVLFFDNASSPAESQVRARQAATKFIDTNAGPNRLMSVVEYSGGLRVAQNFTDDVDRLKSAVGGVKFSALSTNGRGMMANFAARNVLLAVRELAKRLATVPGRKTLIFLSGGFPLRSENLEELKATIDTCNRSNVAVYPIDIRGLVGLPVASAAQVAGGANSFFQRGRGGPRGPSSASDSGAGPPPNAPSFNQQVLYELASGTGGFVIVNTNDLLGGFGKIGKEQSEYYLLGYTPTKDLEPGACHTLKVKVDHSGASVRARSGYCDVKTQDVLAGTAAERDLETRATANAQPTIAASVQASFFYTAADTARVDVAIEMPAAAMTFVKDKGRFHAAMNVVGAAYTADGAVAARFSDAVKFDYEDKKQVDSFQSTPYHYEKQFEMAPGKYTFKVIFSSGAQSFGKVELPLTIEPYDAKHFAFSGLALSRNARSAVGLDASLSDERVPLIVNNVQITPTGSNHFKRSERGYVYGEIYQPALLAPTAKEPILNGVRMQILDLKTGVVKKDSGVTKVGTVPQPGSAVLPIGLRLEFTDLPPGSYRLRVDVGDAAGNQATRFADLEIDP